MGKITQISLKRIKEGYDTNVIHLCISPNGDGVVCEIGTNWFYFGGLTAAEYSDIRLYKKDIPKETIIKEIYETLQGFIESGMDEFLDEYEYYDSVLREAGI